jgi:hypothetical protein
MFIAQQYSFNDELHISAQKGQHGALFKYIKESKLCYYYTCVFRVKSHPYVIHVR